MIADRTYWPMLPHRPFHQKLVWCGPQSDVHPRVQWGEHPGALSWYLVSRIMEPTSVHDHPACGIRSLEGILQVLPFELFLRLRQQVENVLVSWLGFYGLLHLSLGQFNLGCLNKIKECLVLVLSMCYHHLHCFCGLNLVLIGFLVLLSRWSAPT